MGAQAVALWAAVDCVLVRVVPLAVEIICHVHDVVGQIRHFLDMVAPEVPERSRRAKGDGLVGRHRGSQLGEEGEIVRGILGRASWNTGDIRGSGV